MSQSKSLNVNTFGGINMMKMLIRLDVLTKVLIRLPVH